MSAELEKLARQFRLTGNEDIAAGVSALADVAKARGIETFETPKKQVFILKKRTPLMDTFPTNPFIKINREYPKPTMTPGQMEEATGLPHRRYWETEDGRIENWELEPERLKRILKKIPKETQINSSFESEFYPKLTPAQMEEAAAGAPRKPRRGDMIDEPRKPYWETESERQFFERHK